MNAQADVQHVIMLVSVRLRLASAPAWFILSQSDICRDIDQILLIFRFGKAGTLARVLQCNNRSSTFSVFPGSSPGAGNNIHRLTFPGVVSPQSDRATSCWSLSCKQHLLGREKQKISALLALVWYSCQNAKQQCCTRRLCGKPTHQLNSGG